MNELLPSHIIFPILNLSLSLFFFIFFLFSSRHGRYPNILLGIGMSIFLLHNMADILNIVKQHFTMSGFRTVVMILMWLWGPIVYLYLRSIVVVNEKNYQHYHLLHLIPAGIHTGMWLILFTANEFNFVETTISNHNFNDFYGVSNFTVHLARFVHLSSYFLVSVFMFIHYFRMNSSRSKKTDFDNDVPPTVQRLCILLILTWGYHIIDYCCLLVIDQFIMPHHITLMLYTCVIAYLGIYRLMGNTQLDSAQAENRNHFGKNDQTTNKAQSTEKYKNSPLSSETSRQIAEELGSLMLTGIDRPDKGSIYFQNQAIHELSETKLSVWRRHQVGIVFQFFQLLPTLTALENVILPMDFSTKWPARKRHQRALTLLSRVGLSGLENKLPSMLSGGEQQRVAIARAVANDPALIVADEPTGNLDSQTSQNVLALFSELVHEGKTVLMVTHDLMASALANRSISLADGNLLDNTKETAGEDLQNA